MADGVVYPADGIITFAAADSLLKERMAVENIVLTGTAAGSFVMEIGNAPMTIVTGANDLTKVIPLNRSINYFKLTSGPAGAAAYLLLEKKK